MTCPHPPLHRPLLSQIPHILGTLNFVGVSNIPLVNLDLLPRVQKTMQHFVEYFNISELTRWVWTLDPHQVAPQDTHAQLTAEGGFSLLTCGTQMRSLLSPSPFGGHGSQSHQLS
jgi:hypothetical protein